MAANTAVAAAAQTKSSPSLQGFDGPVYTILVGPSHEKLLVPGYLLSKLPPVNKLIVDEALKENEPVAFEAYDPEAFAKVLAMIRDGYKEEFVLGSSRAYIQCYIVAYDLNLEEIQNLLIDKLKDLHEFRSIQAEDFQLTYAARLPSNCKVRALLLHKIAHHFDMGLNRCAEAVRTSSSCHPEKFTQMIELDKEDLVEVCSQLALIPAKGRCEVCWDQCHFHDHNITPPCISPNAITKISPDTLAVNQTEIEKNDLIFNSGAALPQTTIDANLSAAMFSFGRFLAVNASRTTHAKVTKWLEEGADCTGKKSPKAPKAASDKITFRVSAPLDNPSTSHDALTSEACKLFSQHVPYWNRPTSGHATTSPAPAAADIAFCGTVSHEQADKLKMTGTGQFSSAQQEQVHNIPTSRPKTLMPPVGENQFSHPSTPQEGGEANPSPFMSRSTLSRNAVGKSNEVATKREVTVKEPDVADDKVPSQMRATGKSKDSELLHEMAVEVNGYIEALGMEK